MYADIFFFEFEILDTRWATPRQLSPRLNYGTQYSSKSPHGNLDRWQLDPANYGKLYRYKINKYI